VQEAAAFGAGPVGVGVEGKPGGLEQAAIDLVGSTALHLVGR
jgi:hypothetical protein